jgi:Fe-S-cluster containining protein
MERKLMKRDIDINDISDGRLYSLNDMVRADCNDCPGCSSCCRGMGESIILDPRDIFQMSLGTGKSPKELLETYLELQVVEGIILPHLRQEGEAEACLFLDAQGRCRIHAFRPGICRLFPLGRIYENQEVKYFLQIHECPKPSKGKVKVKKWLDVPETKQYEQFILEWHYFLLDLQDEMERRADDSFQKEVNMLLLQLFFLCPYEMERDFYRQFQERKNQVQQAITVNYSFRV